MRSLKKLKSPDATVTSRTPNSGIEILGVSLEETKSIVSSLDNFQISIIGESRLGLFLGTASSDNVDERTIKTLKEYFRRAKIPTIKASDLSLVKWEDKGYKGRLEL